MTIASRLGWSWLLPIVVGVAVVPAGALAETNTRTDAGLFSFDCETVASVPAETPDYVEKVAREIGRMWNLGAGDPDVMKSRITMRVCFAEDGRPVRMILLAAEGPTEVSVTKLYDTARRAVNRAYADGGLPLPADKFDTWRVLDLVFDANGMRAR